ncbi:MAG: nuclear transport factor 2 family protein [Dehalococcoidia bacterium]
MSPTAQLIPTPSSGSSEMLAPLSTVGRVIHAMANGHEAPAELFASDFRQYGPGRDLFGKGDASSRTFEAFSGFEDVSFNVRRFVARGDKVLAYVSFSGVPREATASGGGGRRSADGYLSFRLRDGLISEQWSVLRWSR